jgi:hypothetical protein
MMQSLYLLFPYLYRTDAGAAIYGFQPAAARYLTFIGASFSLVERKMKHSKKYEYHSAEGKLPTAKSLSMRSA